METTQYKVVIYNPHMDETRVEDWRISGAVGSEERVMVCDRFNRHIEAAKGQGCTVGVWCAEDFRNGWWKRGYGWEKGATIHETFKRRHQHES